MNTELLSLRLQTVVKYIPQGFRLADIGSDHAYLPCHVAQKGLVPFAIAGEVVEGPYQSALRQVELEGLGTKISVRMGDGLEVINPGEIDVITICGMGGTLISTILEQGKEKLNSVKRLILQPNVGSSSLRQWLIDNDWMLFQEEILAEDGKVYEVLVAERGEPLAGYDKADLETGLLFGPYLKKQQNEAFKQKWFMEKENWLRILRSLEKAEDNPQNQQRKQELLQRVRMVEEVIKHEES